MAKSIVELSPTVKCTKKDCGFDIPVIDCYFIAQAEVPQIGIKCPECGKVTTLSKAKSIAYAKEYQQIQQDIDNAAGYKIGESDDEEFGDRVIRLLDAFGYGGTKNTQRKKIIRSMIDLVPGYQNQQALDQLLITRGIKPMDAHQISQLACIDDIGMTNSMQLPTGQPQYPYPQPTGQPQYPYPQQPVQSQVSPVVKNATSDDEITIIEKLDSDGNVKERIIKQPKAHTVGQSTADQSMVEQFKDLIEVMTNAGMINTTTTDDHPQPLTADDLEAVISTYLTNDRQKPDDDRYDTVLEELKSLKTKLERKEREDMQAQIDSLKADIGKSKVGLSDAQFSESIKKDIEAMRVDAIRDSLDQIVKPVMEMQANQSKFQTAMMISQLEQQRNVPPGTYAQMFGTTVSDDTVKSDIEKWRNRAEKVSKH